MSASINENDMATPLLKANAPSTTTSSRSSNAANVPVSMSGSLNAGEGADTGVAELAPPPLEKEESFSEDMLVARPQLFKHEVRAVYRVSTTPVHG